MLIQWGRLWFSGQKKRRKTAAYRFRFAPSYPVDTRGVPDPSRGIPVDPRASLPTMHIHLSHRDGMTPGWLYQGLEDMKPVLFSTQTSGSKTHQHWRRPLPSATPRCSMSGIFTYIWVIFRANVGKYSSTMEHLGQLSWWAMGPCADFE